MTTTNQTRIEKMSSFSGVAWEQTATLNIPTGRIYQSIFLKTNLTPAQLKVARLTLNTEQIYVPSGVDLIAYQRMLGQKVVDGYFVIPFANTTMREQGGIMATALVTQPNDAITLELDLGVQGSTVGNPTIEVWAVVSDATNPDGTAIPRVMMPRWQYQSMQAGAVGDNTFETLTWAPYRYVTDMVFKSDAITQLKIDRDYVQVFKADTVVNNYVMQQQNQDLVPTSGVFWFNPTQRGMLKDYVFPTAHRNQLKFTVVCSKTVASIEILVRSFEVVRPDYFSK